MSEIMNLYPTLGASNVNFADIPQEIQKRERANEKYKRDQEQTRIKDEDQSYKRMLQARDRFLRKAGRTHGQGSMKKLIEKYKQESIRNGWDDPNIASVERVNEHYVLITEKDDEEPDGVAKYYQRYSGKDTKENLEFTADGTKKMQAFTDKINSGGKKQKQKYSNTQLRLAKEKRDERREALDKAIEEHKDEHDPKKKAALEKKMRHARSLWSESAADYFRMRDEVNNKDTKPKWPTFGNKKEQRKAKKEVEEAQPKVTPTTLGNRNPVATPQDPVVAQQNPPPVMENNANPVVDPQIQPEQVEPVDNVIAQNRFGGNRRLMRQREEEINQSNIRKYGPQPERRPYAPLLPSSERIIDVELKPVPGSRPVGNQHLANQDPVEPEQVQNTPAPEGEPITPEYLLEESENIPGLGEEIQRLTNEIEPNISDWKTWLRQASPAERKLFMDTVISNLDYSVEMPSDDIQFIPPPTEAEQEFEQQGEFYQYAVEKMPMLSNPDVKREVREKQLRVLYNLFKKEQQQNNLFQDSPVGIPSYAPGIPLTVRGNYGSGGGGGDFFKLR